MVQFLEKLIYSFFKCGKFFILTGLIKLSKYKKKKDLKYKSKIKQKQYNWCYSKVKCGNWRLPGDSKEELLAGDAQTGVQWPSLALMFNVQVRIFGF